MMRVGTGFGRGAWIMLAAVLASCADGTGPNLQGAEVRILLNGGRYDEQTIAVGATLVLDADVYDATGNRVEGHTFQWSSEDEAVASVSAAGVVTGHSVGTTRIVARHSVGEASAIVNVAVPLAGPPTCPAGEAPSFQVGVPRTFAGNDAASICLPAGGEYSVVLVNAGSAATARLQTRVTATGLRNSFGPPAPLLAPGSTLATNPRPTASEAFHQRMRGDISARLEPRLGGASAALMPTGPALQTTVGQLLNFNVETRSQDGCSAQDIDRRVAEVRLVTERAILVEDTLNPAGYTAADFQEFGALFDNEIWPLVTSTFGEPTDIDNNGKVYIFFTMAVNQRRENSTMGNQGSFVGGFFFNRDLFPTRGRSSCAGSNAAEMFYLLVPDPNGEVRGTDGQNEWSGRPFSVDFVKRHAPAVIVHEFQHLINDSRRLHLTKSMVWEETWLNEGLSHIAEELMFFDQAGLQPRQNLSAATFQNNLLARSEFSRFQLANLDRLAAMLRSPAHSSLMGSDQLETRGAAWYFLRYAADRRGGDEQAFWRALVRDASTSGLANLERVLGTDPRPWIADWTAAVYLDDSGVAVPPEYRISSWNFRSIYPAAGTLWPGNLFTQFPLQVYGLANSGGQTLCRLGSSAQSCDYSLQGGSAAYLRTGTGAAGTGGFRVTVGGLPAPSRLRVIVTRLS